MSNTQNPGAEQGQSLWMEGREYTPMVPQTSPFLVLPTDIRIKIYQLAYNPVKDDISLFSGLCLSCKFLYNELSGEDGELVKIAARFYADKVARVCEVLEEDIREVPEAGAIQDESVIPPIHIPRPKKLRDINRPELHLPRVIFTDEWRRSLDEYLDLVRHQLQRRAAKRYHISFYGPPIDDNDMLWRSPWCSEIHIWKFIDFARMMLGRERAGFRIG